MRQWPSGAGSMVSCWMSSQGKSWSTAVAVCPRPEHAGSRVRFDGRYGPPEHRRQLYKCVPVNGDRPHRFTEPLPREESWHGACELLSDTLGGDGEGRASLRAGAASH